MRIRIFRSLALILVVSLIFSGSICAAATEPTEPAVPEETVAPTEESAVLEETLPEQTDPEETEPVEEAKVYTVDTQSQMYQVLDALAPALASDQILVFDATNDEILYTRSLEGEKLYPASITKL